MSRSNNKKNRAHSEAYKHDQLHLMAATKVSHRSENGKNSIWRMTFCNSVGKRIHINYSAEHNYAKDDKRPRNQRYASGSAGIVKRLHCLTPTLGLPSILALKSQLTASQTDKYSATLAEDFVNLYNTDKAGKLNALSLMRAFGLDAIAIKRQHNGKNKYAVISTFIGAGADLFDMNRADSPTHKAIAATDIGRIAVAFCRYLGRLYYCQRSTGRPMIDIKSENIIPVLDKSNHLADLIPIDLDSSTGNAVNYTLECLSPDDAEIIARLFRKKSVSADDVKTLPMCIDYHGAAYVLAEILNTSEPGLFNISEVEHTLSDQLFYDYTLNKVSTRHKKLLNLFQYLKESSIHSDLPSIIKHCFGENSTAFQSFAKTVVECKSRSAEHITAQAQYKSRHAAPRIARSRKLPSVFRAPHKAKFESKLEPKHESKLEPKHESKLEPKHESKLESQKSMCHVSSLADIRSAARAVVVRS